MDEYRRTTIELLRLSDSEIDVGSFEAVDDVEMIQIEGGITNSIVLVRNKRHGPSVLLKLYGQGSEQFINRTQELDVMQILSEHKISPRVFASSSSCRVEEYLEGFRPLTPTELCSGQFGGEIACSIAQLHKVPLPERYSASVLAQTLADWRTKTKAIGLPPGVDASRVDSFISLIHAENQASTQCHFLDHTVFSHNDLLSGNMLWSEEEKRIALIDFEYTSANPAGFDIANHFCEYPGFEGDMASLYPNEEFQMRFVGTYLEQRGLPSVEDKNEWRRVLRKLHFYAIASSLWWGLWAVIQSASSAIDFNYSEYACSRLGKGINFHSERLERLGEDA